jgi:hypothetical protein
MYTELALKCTRIFKLLYIFSNSEPRFYWHLLCTQPLVSCVPQQLTCKIKVRSSLRCKVSEKNLSLAEVTFATTGQQSLPSQFSLVWRDPLNEASLMDTLLSWIVLPSRRRRTKFQGIYFSGETKNHG